MPAAAFAALIVFVVSAVAQAQGINPGPPGPFVIDLRGATSSVPSLGQFYPVVDNDPDEDEELTVPARGYGFEVGAHVYAFRLGPARVGFGVSYTRARATAVSGLVEGDSSNGDEDADDVPETLATVDVIATGQTLAPQVSFNFGTSDGWSYVSAGYGRASVRTQVGRDLERDTTGLTAINVGGGARWFFTGHLGIGFDLRWHKIGSSDRTPGTSMFAVVVGLSVK